MEKRVFTGAAKPRLLMFRWAWWFMLANGILLMLVSFNFLKVMPFPNDLPGWTFLGLSYPGHFLSLALYVTPLLAAGILLYPRRRLVFSLAVVLELCLVLGVIIDSLVFAQYRFHLNGMVWNLLTSGAAGEVLPVTDKLWLILAGAILVLGGVEWFFAHLSWRWVHRKRKRVGLGVGAVIFAVVLSAHAMHAWGDANNVTSITSEVRYLPAYKPLTMKRMLVKLGLASREGKRGLKMAEGKSALKYPLEKLAFGGEPKKMNLLFIVIDSWRFDNLSREITPNIARFAEQSWQFENHYSSGNCTRFGIFGLFYGLYGTYWHAALAEERSPVLMQELERRNYRIGAFGSATLVNPEFDRTVFADVRGQIPLKTQGGSPSQKDRVITDKMVDFISKNPAGQPFFGFMFYDAPHCADNPATVAPFQPSLKEVNYLALNNDYDPLPFYNKYKNSVYYVDTLVKEVLAALEKKKLLDSTIVVITGDHGQEFNELKQNYWGHGGNFSRYQTQTPLVIRWPGNAPKHFSQVTSHLDLAPTLMKGMFGCQTDPSRYSNGRYLTDTTARPFTVMSAWDTFSINEADRITVSQPTGEVEILDNAYRPLKGAQPRTRISKDAMEGMGRFFAR